MLHSIDSRYFSARFQVIITQTNNNRLKINSTKTFENLIIFLNMNNSLLHENLN